MFARWTVIRFFAHWLGADNRRLLLVSPPLAVALVSVAPAAAFLRLAWGESGNSSGVRDAALLAFGVYAALTLVTYLIGLSALLAVTALRVRLETISAERAVISGAALGVIMGAVTAPVIGTGASVGGLTGAVLGATAGLVFAWLRGRLTALHSAS